MNEVLEAILRHEVGTLEAEVRWLRVVVLALIRALTERELVDAATLRDAVAYVEAQRAVDRALYGVEPPEAGAA
jgi:hypothetical protein